MAFSNENLVLHLRYMIPFFQHLFEWLFQKKKPFTKWFLQHAYINENSTRSDCIHLYGHFVFSCIYFILNLKLFHYSNIAQLDK